MILSIDLVLVFSLIENRVNCWLQFENSTAFSQSKSYGLGRDASKISIDMIDRYHSQQNLSDLEESGSVHGVHPSKNRVYTKWLLVLLIHFRDISGPTNIVTLDWCVHRVQPVNEGGIFQNGRFHEKNPGVRSM